MRSRVLVLGAEENPSLPIIESLNKRGIEVTVASHKKICVGFFSKYAQKRLLYPSPEIHPERFINSIIKLLKKDKYQVTMACGEQPTYLISKYKDMLTAYTCIPIVDFDTFLKCRDKSKTMKIASQMDIPCPKTYFPEEEDIKYIRDKLEYPALVKPCVSDGARGIAYVGSKEALIKTYQRVKERYGACIVQERIPHQGMQYKAELLLDENSEVKAGVVYNKLRYYPPTGGSSTLNCTVDRKDILELGTRILKQIGWYGMGDCDFIEDPRNSTPKLMEINPRFTRSIKVCTAAGVDFPYMLYKLAIGEEIPTIKEYKVGQYLRYFFGDVMWFAKSSNRLKTKPNFFKFWDKHLQYEVISLQDPGPALAFILSALQVLIDRKERQFRLR